MNTIIQVFLILVIFVITNSIKNNRLDKFVDPFLIFLILFFSSFFFRWDLFSVYSKYLLILLVFCNLIWTLTKGKYIFRIKTRIFRYFKYVFLLVFICLDVLVIWGFGIGKSDELIEFSSPLRNGKYYVVQGGRPPVLNRYHYKNNVLDKYSIDIVKLNSLGFSTRKLFVEKVTDFNIYNDTVYSPCDGFVVDVRQELECNVNLLNNLNKNERTINNIVIIKHNEYELILAHLKKGSINLEKGQIIKQNDFIGLVSNAGAIEAHLHMQLLLDWESMPFKIDGEFLHNNSILRYKLK